MLSKQPHLNDKARAPKNLRAHRQAALVPSMSAVEAQALRADIARRGIQVPLDITAAGVVLDGRHRHRIALELGLPEVPVRVVEPPDEIDFMLSAAIQRRQLSPSQRAALVLGLRDYLEQKAAAAARKNDNLRNGGLDVATLPHRGGRSRDHAATLAGVSSRLVQDAIRVKESAPDLLEKVKAGKIPLRRALQQIERDERYAQIGPSPPLPAGQFDVLYADPPWQIGSPSSGWSPEQHYPTMSTEEIAALAVPAAENAVLFLWAVNCLLPGALEVITAWGFTYKSCLVWVKDSIGPGGYVRNRHELLLIATRGSYPSPVTWRRADSVVAAKRRRHSEKPERFSELIEQMYPNATRLELFARGKARPGWTFWGNEVEA